MIVEEENIPVFVLIHGAFRGGWSWQKARRILQARDYEAFAPSLSGAGERAHLNRPDILLEDWVNDVTALLNAEDLKNVILVGHSQGGIVIQAVAEAVPERIAKLVFIDAPVLRDGECAVDAIPAEIRAKFGETPANALIPPMPLKVSQDFTEQEVSWINARLTAVPTNPSLERIQIARSFKIPHEYIFCAQTPPVYPASFTRHRFEAEGVKYLLIDTGHDCIMTHPQLIADLLVEIAAK
jgi:pimeloyl-ACP methyl ester carboxylesterase